jgi:hypothetical protein
MEGEMEIHLDATKATTSNQRNGKVCKQLQMEYGPVEDAIHYKECNDKGSAESRAIYNVIGIDKNSSKDLLNMYVSHSEDANFWLGVLTDFQNRGVKNSL